MRRAMILALTLLPVMARSDVLTFEVWPDRNPDRMVSCRIERRGPEMNVLEVLGAGMPPSQPMRWPVRRVEEAVLLAALQDLISGDLPGVEIYSSRLPPAPYVTVTWSATVNAAPVSGLYVQQGLRLPPVLAQVIDTVLPGGPCEAALLKVVE